MKSFHATRFPDGGPDTETRRQRSPVTEERTLI
jgi:hypothetical protein